MWLAIAILYDLDRRDICDAGLRYLVEEFVDGLDAVKLECGYAHTGMLWPRC